MLQKPRFYLISLSEPKYLLGEGYWFYLIMLFTPELPVSCTTNGVTATSGVLILPGLTESIAIYGALRD